VALARSLRTKSRRDEVTQPEESEHTGAGFESRVTSAGHGPAGLLPPQLRPVRADDAEALAWAKRLCLSLRPRSRTPRGPVRCLIAVGDDLGSSTWRRSVAGTGVARDAIASRLSAGMPIVIGVAPPPTS
jgi:hypothetical protein